MTINDGGGDDDDDDDDGDGGGAGGSLVVIVHSPLQNFCPILHRECQGAVLCLISGNDWVVHAITLFFCSNVEQLLHNYVNS